MRVDLLSYRGLLMSLDAVHTVERLWGGERALKRRAPVPPPEAAPAPTVEKAKKARPKTTTRRPKAEPAPASAIEKAKKARPKTTTRQRKAEPAPAASEKKAAAPKPSRRRVSQTRSAGKKKPAEASES
jgi:hypothetical protein